MNTVLNFGKYKGKTYEEVMKNHSEYCDWILSRNMKNQEGKDFVEFLQKNGYSSNKLDDLKIMDEIPVTKLLRYPLGFTPDDVLGKPTEIVEDQLDYPEFIGAKLCPLWGTFLEFVMRHYILSRKGDDKRDAKTEKVAQHLRYFNGDIEKQKLFVESYSVFQEYTDTDEILDDIWNVSIGASLYLGSIKNAELIGMDIDVPEEHILRVFAFCDLLLEKYTKFEFGKWLSGYNVIGECDCIIDDCIILDMKVSKESVNIKSNKMQMILYSALFKKNKISRIILFNPLGTTYVWNTSDNYFESDIRVVLKRLQIGVDNEKDIENTPPSLCERVFSFFTNLFKF